MIANSLDQVNKNHKKSRGAATFQYQFIKCRDCGKVLRICQIQRKNIGNCQEFTVFTYYCRKCKLTYYVFNFIDKKEVKRNGLSNGFRMGSDGI
ncbi:MAG: hypothetical protein ACTSQJ_01785 [Promethearchaeota archaeon]